MITVLDNPEQIAKISKHKFFIISNSSLVLFADKRWKKWQKILQNKSAHTILFDLPPSIHIDKIAKQYPVIKYIKIHLTMGKACYPFVCLIAKGTLPTGIFFFPCSEILANILIEFISLKSYSDNYKKNNSTLNRIIHYGISHLIDESIFNFRSLNSKYALRAFSENQFLKR